MDALISQPDLMEWPGIKQKTALIKWMIQNRIPFYYGRNGEVVTTYAAINQPLIGTEPQQPKKQPLKFL
ncbi:MULTISPECIES: hypothetical protein [unclassified Endozoicomonas]|uniref:hypothetical protein n=1 Tax=unclassified Endozoicomonas TaxID=2644528 RepID=UPI003BB63019